MSARRMLWPLLILLLIVSSIYLQQNRAMLTIRSTAGDFLSPLQAAASGLTGFSKGFFGSFRATQSLQQENEDLRQMVDELRRKNVELWQTIAQQQKVTEERGFQQANPQWNYLSARVIAWDPSNLVRTVAVNKGRSDGVAMGMVVVSSSGLVGKVVEMSDRWSRVLLVNDPRSSVNGMLQRSADGSKGMLQGRPDGLLRMKYLQAESGVQKGDVVVTSGLGGGFPPGLFVGWILEVSYSDGQMFHEALVRPASNLFDLSDLMILTNFAPLSLD